ncbi:hypothetical protein HMPREF1981_01136, partial [Bacteroides pyogenes F0041]
MYKKKYGKYRFNPPQAGGQSGTFFLFKANNRKQFAVCVAVKAVFSSHLKPITGSNALFAVQ